MHQEQVWAPPLSVQLVVGLSVSPVPSYVVFVSCLIDFDSGTKHIAIELLGGTDVTTTLLKRPV